MNDIFSVIILVYNNSQYLKTCIDSILIQKYNLIEIIIADDGSMTFDPLEFFNYINENSRGNIINVDIYSNEQNLGTVKNINTALEHAAGKYIKLIAADDALYDEDTLNNAKRELDLSSDYVITSDVVKCDENLIEQSFYESSLQQNLNNMSAFECFKKLTIHNDIIAGGVFLTKEFYEKFGKYDENYVLLEDWPMWLHVTKNGGRIRYSNFYSLKYRTNVGTGTGINKQYLADKKNVLLNIIIPNKKTIGLTTYLHARVKFFIINNILVRKMYGLIFR